MHPIGVCELHDLGQLEKRSEDGEEFTTRISELHEQVKARLQHSNTSYNAKAYSKRREKNYEVGDLVLAYLKRDIFPKGEHNKLKMKKIGPCRILRKFLANSYDLEMPIVVGISPIFNVADLYPYVVGDTGTFAEGEYPTEDLQWVRQIPVAQPLEVEAILDTKVVKSTRRKDYLEYLVKWKKRTIEHSTWMNAVELEAKGFTVHDLMNRGS